eukprot:CAMPEP_0194295458 /NCGR_PEP_ID=MMETSP0169-20130528/53499_1 /TAXON_ID=218684 /ORGANISM="Corethron pennatum, Strain L29A3" /LENGTH=264 /DNA_ID=CAMNT_0039044621 /DNA_START=35 /DNA_END=826 /DNA_ORIENTATION=+
MLTTEPAASITVASDEPALITSCDLKNIKKQDDSQIDENLRIEKTDTTCSNVEISSSKAKIDPKKESIVTAIDDTAEGRRQTLQNIRNSAIPVQNSFQNPDSNDQYQLVDRHFRYVAVGVVITFMGLVSFCYMITPRSQLEYLTGSERMVALSGFAVLLISCLSNLVPLFYKRKVTKIANTATASANGATDVVPNGWNKNAASGIIVAVIAVQGVAMLTYTLMSFFPVPMRTDPVLGTRVHLLRWCEWTPLGFAMTFMTEGVDL